MHFFRTQLWTAVIWGMVPIAVVTGMPRMGCICANGQYKLFCERHWDRCCQHGVKDSGELCPCCHKSHVERTIPHAPKIASEAGCCHRSAGCPNGPRLSQRCCTPVVGMPVLPPVAQPVVIPDLSAQSLLICPLGLPQVLVVSPNNESVRSPVLPVSDLIIAHQVFLI